MVQEKFAQELSIGILSYPIVYVTHSHQQYVEDTLRIKSILPMFPDCCGKSDKVLKKVIDLNPQKELTIDRKDFYVEELSKIVAEFDYACQPGSVYLFRNVSSDVLEDKRFTSLLHRFASNYEKNACNSCSIVLCVPSCMMPPAEIEGIVRLISVTPPDNKVILGEIENFFRDSAEIQKKNLAQVLQGLQLFDIRRILHSIEMVIGPTLVELSCQWAQREKKQVIAKSGVLEIVESDVRLEDVGGLEILKNRIKEVGYIYRNLQKIQAAGFQLTIPKGVLILGMPGCGKTMIAKSIANEFEVPLLRLDMGKLLGKYVGESEHNLHRALEVVDSAHPCILWIDEIEKAFAGTTNKSGDNDPVMMRLMGAFLTWMQERKTAVYIVATANDTLKPEMMRKGRFDDVFFVDFPNKKERDEILRIKTEKYKGKVRFRFNKKEVDIVNYLSEKMDNTRLSGAELMTLADEVVNCALSMQIANMTETQELPHVIDANLEAEEFGKIIESAINSALYRQKEKSGSFINRIYACKDEYNISPAS